MVTPSTIDIDLRAASRNRNVRLDPRCLDAPPSICKAADDLRSSKPHRGECMTSFDKREEAFEQQFAHDEELRFKAIARRNKLLGLWAAEKLGLSGAEADSYALSLVMSQFEDTGERDVLRKIRKDFDAKGVDQSDHQVSRHATELMAQAIQTIKAGK
jgi:hypothetical protein